MLARVTRLALILTVCTSIGCGDIAVTNPVQEVMSGQLRWAQNGSDSYTITVTRSCDCPPEEEGSVVVTVTDGMVDSRVYTSNGTHVPTYLTPLFPSIEELFDIVVVARMEHVGPISEAYDATFGFPTRVEMPASPTEAGDAATYEMWNLVLR